MQRSNILKTFAEWTSFSSTRSGSPLKSRADVYPLIRLPDYNTIFDGPVISEKEFGIWHRKNSELISHNSCLPIGWSTKLINVYLKTLVYLAQEGRENLINLIHPPIDTGLWDGIKKYCEKHELDHVLTQTHLVTRIKNIQYYDTYQTIICGCKQLAEHLNCSLIEVEQLWQGTSF